MDSCTPSSKSFKLGMLREREGAQQSSEEAVDGVGKQRAWGGVNRRHIALTEVELSQAYVWKLGGTYGTALWRRKLSYPLWEISILGCLSEMPVH